MKRLYTLSTFVIAIAAVVLMAGFGGVENSDYPVGAPPGYTNSPADGQNCSHCMGGTAVPVADWITSNIPVTGYVAGATYTIVVTATGDGNKGFELSPQDPSGNLLGTLIAGTDSKLVGSDKYVTHTTSETENPKSWSFQWTAPATPVGTITFYACAAVGQLNTKITTMVAPQSTLSIRDQLTSPLTVYPNPVKDKLTVSFTMMSDEPVHLDLLSVRGGTMSNLFQDDCSAGDHTMSFPVDVKAGIYLLRFQAGPTLQVSKVIVQ